MLAQALCPLASYKRILEASESSKQCKDLGLFCLGRRNETWTRR